MKKPSIGKEYFNRMDLEAIVTNYPYRKNLAEEDIRKGKALCGTKLCFLGTSSRDCNLLTESLSLCVLGVSPYFIELFLT